MSKRKMGSEKQEKKQLQRKIKKIARKVEKKVIIKKGEKERKISRVESLQLFLSRYIYFTIEI